MKNTFDLKNTYKRLSSVIRSLPTRIAIIVENNIADNFKSESFNGQKWKPRKRPSRADLNNKNKRALLVDSGQLKREATNATVNGNRIEVSSSLPYADVHNQGNETTPKRQFAGQSKVLDKAIEKEIERQLNKVFRY